MRRYYRSALSFTFLVVLAGCGQNSAEEIKFYPVTGQIIYDGKPMAGVRVMLLPVNAPSPPQVPAFPSAVTDSEGKFRLASGAAGEGAAPGGYQVILDSTPSNVAETGNEDAEDIFKGWFDAMHSNLKVQIKPEANAIAPFKIAKITKPAGESEGVPGRN